MSERLERLWYPKQPEGWGRRAALSPLSMASWAFRAAVEARNALYDHGALARRNVEGLRVLSVGNLNVGGAGKTPAVIHLTRLALTRGLRVAVLSRGHGRTEQGDRVVMATSSPSEVGDEPLLILRRCPGSVVLVGSDRARLAEKAQREHGAQLVILDDGLQHRRLSRDSDLVVVDEAVGFGNRQLLPRGPLREPLGALRRASLIWLRLSEGRAALLPDFEAPVVRARHRATELLAPGGEVHSARALEGRSVLALSGLARPGSFRRTLESLGARVCAVRSFEDHHVFSPEEIEEAQAAAAAAKAELVTTEKDLARLPAGLPVWVLRLDVEIVSGEEHLLQALGLAL